MIQDNATCFPPIPTGKGSFCYPPSVSSIPVESPPAVGSRDALERLITENVEKLEKLIESQIRRTQNNAGNEETDSELEEDDFEEESYEGQEYEIEKILDKRNNNGRKEYLVEWKHYYGAERQSWTSRAALENCTEALQEFKNRRKRNKLFTNLK